MVTVLDSGTAARGAGPGRPTIGCLPMLPAATTRITIATPVFRTIDRLPELPAPALSRPSPPAPCRWAQPPSKHCRPPAACCLLLLLLLLLPAGTDLGWSWALAAPRRRHGRPLHHQGAWQGYVCNWPAHSSQRLSRRRALLTRCAAAPSAIIEAIRRTAQNDVRDAPPALRRRPSGKSRACF